MYYNIMDYLKNLPTGVLVLGTFFVIVVVLLASVIYIFSSYGIMQVATKNKIPNAWLAFIPFARYYIIGKLGFEVYPEENKKNPNLTWILLGLSIGNALLSSYDYSNLIRIAVIVFNTIAFYNIFKVIAPKNATLFTIITIFVEYLGGIFLYALRNNLDDNLVKEAIVVEETKDKAKDKEINEEPKPKTKAKKVENTDSDTKKERPNFCPNCGNKLPKTAKFCGNCGKEIK